MLTSAPAVNTPFTCLATALFDKLASSARAASLFCPGLGTVCPRPEPPQLPRRLAELILIVHKTNKDPCTRRATEVAIAIKSLNRMNQLGRAIFTRIA